MKESAEELLKPPADAVAVDLTQLPLKLDKDGGRLVILKFAIPMYPESAKASQLQGAVLIQMTVDKDGHVQSPNVVSGPFSLQPSALEAVQRMLYEPFQVVGHPVEVETQITVRFDMR